MEFVNMPEQIHLAVYIYIYIYIYIYQFQISLNYISFLKRTLMNTQILNKINKEKMKLHIL